MKRLQDELRRNYLDGHSRNVSSAVYKDLRALWPYFEGNYAFLLSLPRSVRVLEIGSGSGSLIAWLIDHGFSNLTGIDISAQEVEQAATRGLPLVCADAHEYLATLEPNGVDIVIAKAMFEHLPKQDGADLLKAVARVLNPEQGMLVLDVPNMDWLLSNHERYMDLTHHVGYTKESISQMMNLYFEAVDVRGSVERAESLAARIRVRLVKPMLVGVLRFLLRIMGEGAANVMFESRSIIAVGKGASHS